LPLEPDGALEGADRPEEESELLEPLELEPDDAEPLDPLLVDPDDDPELEVVAVVLFAVVFFEPLPLRSLAAVAENTPTSATRAPGAPLVIRRSRRPPRSRRPTAWSVPGSGSPTSMTVSPPVAFARKTKQRLPEAVVRVA
jgi:hypothetical protein